MYNLPVLSVVCDGTQKISTNKVTAPAQAVEVAKPIFDGIDREQFAILLLNTKNHPLGLHIVSIGSLSASIVHPREVFKIALLKNASSVICFHNHPSGEPEPSQQDLEVMRRLTDAGNVLGITVRDSIILGGEDRHFSFRERGLL